MKNILKENIVTVLLTFTAIILLVTSFVIPPRGVIDPSVLTATGEIFAFAALWSFIVSYSKGKSVTFTKGDTSISVDEK